MRRHLATLTAVLVILVGAGLLVGGAVGLSSPEVTCGGRVLAPGQPCEFNRAGRPKSRTYDEQRSTDRIARVVMVVSGVAALGGGIAFIVVRRARRRTD
ncbi:MAG: hypothetical protein WBA05_04405 [Gordonia sp. (in: high G+C Gram-positive bacteria)]|uniref:hypothetical protein n=1 Tax=Gordonia TaxID=2053 RepID=UPI003266EB23